MHVDVQTNQEWCRSNNQMMLESAVHWQDEITKRKNLMKRMMKRMMKMKKKMMTKMK
jgi:hypothetical protein